MTNMSYLLKSESETYSFADLDRNGETPLEWRDQSGCGEESARDEAVRQAGALSHVFRTVGYRH